MTNRFLLALCVVVGCAKATTPEPVGGETHFLHSCDGDTCGLGLDCVCGVCTKACANDNSCGDLNSSATCEAAGTPIGACRNPIASPVCDVECSASADCKSLGANYTCQHGSCRKLDGACVVEGMVYPNHMTTMRGCTLVGCEDGSAIYVNDACPIDGGTDATVSTEVPIDLACVDTNDQDAGFLEPGEWAPRESRPLCPAADVTLQIAGAEVVSSGGRFGGHNAPFEVNGTDVYWLDEEDFVVVRTSLADGRTWKSVYLGRDTSSLLLDDCLLYLGFGRNSDHEVGTIPLNGGGLHLLGGNSANDTAGIMALGLDAAHVYAHSGHKIYRAAQGSGPLEVILEKYVDEGTYYNEMLVLPSRVLVSEVIGGTSFVIHSVSKATPTQVTTFASPTTAATSMTADLTSVYVTVASSTDPQGNPRNDSRLLRFPIEGGAGVEIDPSIRPSGGLQLDGSNLYFSRLELPGNVPTFSLWRTRTSGGSATKLLDNVHSVRLTDSHIYWSQDCAASNNGSEGYFIARIPKPE